MIDGNEIDPEIFDFLEHEFLTYGFFDDQPVAANPPNNNRNPSLNLFDLHGSGNRSRNGNNSLRFPSFSDDLTPLPNFRNQSFDSNPLLSTANVYDLKMYCSLGGIQGPKNLFSPSNASSRWFNCFESFKYYNLTIKIQEETKVFRLVPKSTMGSNSNEVAFTLKPVPKQSRGSSTGSEVSFLPELWEFSDYNGSGSIEMSLSKHSTLHYRKKIISKKSFPLAELMKEQKTQESAQTYFSSGNGFDWLVNMTIDLFPLISPNNKRVIPNINGGNTTTSAHANWWLGKKPRFSAKHPSPTNSIGKNSPVTSSVPPPTAASLTTPTSKPNNTIKLNISFRLIFLQNCLRPFIHSSFLATEEEKAAHVSVFPTVLLISFILFIYLGPF
jgi:hypothetical protein